MAAFPTYAKILLAGTSRRFDPEVIKSEMERGLPKLRIGNSRVVVQIPVRIRTYSREDALAFEAWYHDTIKRIGFFDWYDPRHRLTRSVRFMDGAIGEETPVRSGDHRVADRPATLEYLR